MRLARIDVLKLIVLIGFLLGNISISSGQGGPNPCYGATATDMEFSSSGGSITRYIQPPTGCSATWSVTETIPWLTLSPQTSGTQVVAVVSAYSGYERRGDINIYADGSYVGRIIVWQNKGNVQPPDPCIITGFTPRSVSPSGETESFTLSYSNTCPANITYTFKQIINNTTEADLPGWVNNITQNTTTNQITIHFDANSQTTERTVNIIGKRNDPGTPGIQAIFTQGCIEKDWYLDSDGDGLRDPGSTVEKDCATTKPGYTRTNINIIDVCPNVQNTIAQNTLKTYYRDTDGDSFRDIGGEVRQGCTPPTDGNWTLSQSDDYCPNTFYSSNNGCDPNCGLTLPANTVLEFDEQGGTQVINFSVDAACSGYELTYGPYPNWITVTENESPGTGSISVTVPAYNEFREALGIPIYSNASVQQGGGFSVKQNYDPTPPTCTSSILVDNVPFNGTDISFDLSGGSKTVKIEFDQTICDEALSLVDGITFEALSENWVTFQPTGGTNTWNINVVVNNTGIPNTVYVAAVNQTGDTKAFFRVVQSSCTVQEWYPDQDNDFGGDANAVPRYGCTSPTDMPYVYRSNNWDLCPEDEGLFENNGCPPGTTIEKRNTITTLGYDLNGQLKVGTKAYFDELGKLEQTQAWDIESDSIWVSATLYEEFGRPSVNSLSAPIYEGSNFLYKDGFIKKDNSTNDYDLTDYDGDNAENPNPVDDAAETLGWYYSENNDREPYQDVTDHPFTKSVYSALNPGKILRAVGGNKINNEWPQAYSFTMKASQELSQAIAFGDPAYNTIEITKTVSRDVHGVENVIFTDSDGKVLAAARSGSAGTQSLSMSLSIPEQGFVDIHVAEGLTGFNITSPASVYIYDLISEQQLSGSPGGLPSGFYRVAVNDLDAYVPGTISVSYFVNYYDYSLNEYDEADRLVASYQPLGNSKATKPKTTYEYNTVGQLIYTKSPDEGEAWFKYRDDGQIRYSQNSKQQDPNGDGNFDDAEFSYTDYDNLGRPIESGVVESLDFTNADPNAPRVSGTTKQVFKTFYDSRPESSYFDYPQHEKPTFLSGNVAYTSFRDETFTRYETYYSYDTYGRVKWLVQHIPGITVNNSFALENHKTIHYEYDPIDGLVTKVYFQKGVVGEQFVHRYSYDESNQLDTVETSIDDTSFELQATYKYYENGSLKRTILGEGVNAQGMDYVYNLAGQLKSLNHPSLAQANDPGSDTNDLFGMQVDYHNADYKRAVTNINSQTYGTDQLNGNIKGIRWQNKGAAAQEAIYAYEYDRNNWLKSADFGADGIAQGAEPLVLPNLVVVPGQQEIYENPIRVRIIPESNFQSGSNVVVRIGGGSVGADGSYDVSNITYDANGNIQSLKRNKDNSGSGTAMDDLQYSYQTSNPQFGPNQLRQVTDLAGDVAGADDIGTQTDIDNYVYNGIGQLIENKSEGITYLYNTSGLVTEVAKDDKTIVKFYYNDRNHRVKKERFDIDGTTVVETTHYVRDIPGSIIAIYVNNLIREIPIYGNSRMGVHNRIDGSTQYELTDHLGNVRAVFQRNQSTSASYTDYFPFGSPLPNRIALGNYRYAFQGQEKDPETGKEAFELRLWDGRIGRWLTSDPAGQYNSPYLGMGNNPISLVDPDGGFSRPPRTRFGRWRRKTVSNIGDFFKRNFGRMRPLRTDKKTGRRWRAWMLKQGGPRYVQNRRDKLGRVETFNSGLLLIEDELGAQLLTNKLFVFSTPITLTGIRFPGSNYNTGTGISRLSNSMIETNGFTRDLASFLNATPGSTIRIDFPAIPNQLFGAATTAGMRNHLNREYNSRFQRLVRRLRGLGVDPSRVLWGTHNRPVTGQFGNSAFNPLTIIPAPWQSGN